MDLALLSFVANSSYRGPAFVFVLICSIFLLLAAFDSYICYSSGTFRLYLYHIPNA